MCRSLKETAFKDILYSTNFYCYDNKYLKALYKKCFLSCSFNLNSATFIL